MSVLRRSLTPFTSLALCATIGITSTESAQALTMVDCAALSASVYASVNPKTNATLLTRSASEAKNASRFGFSQYLGSVFQASQYQTDGLLPVRRLARDGDFAYELDAARIRALTSSGYTDEGTAFYAATSSDWCTQPVREAEKGGTHRYTVSQREFGSLTANGWSAGPTVFHVAASPIDYGEPTSAKPVVTDGTSNDNKFTFAVIPDTQPEIWKASDPRFANRSKWLVDNKAKYDVRWAIQTGDLVDWDDATHSQYENAKVGLALSMESCRTS